MRLFVLAFVFQLIALVYGLKEPPKDLQIGVKKRVPAEECKIRSRDGRDKLSMHYTGTLFDTGEKFDSSLDRNQPLQFTLGVGQVIKGWDQGLKNMCIGEKRRLVIPPALGYGAQGAGSAIPGGATLVFEVELVDIKQGPGMQKKPAITQDKGIADTISKALENPTYLGLAGACVLALIIALVKGGSSKQVIEKKETTTDKSTSSSSSSSGKKSKKVN
ncbi:fk506-binding protein 2 [Lichtheimia corymbifera JMRC:FSU:9682]|uniref:peptidylprolyl isomerase n=1 Tax=Lichtheimia corymbifera JMRC:FSU:9682 TaxID=1263082 RepID=A0A068RM88_9FUNG|nr:fk506-binding protein 2 [Lichtheimia corymbifera JMRC:FSU:9682]